MNQQQERNHETTFKIEAARINTGYSQQEVADILGISVKAYRDCVAGKTPTRNERIIALSSIFGVQPHQLVVPKYVGK